MVAMQFSCPHCGGLFQVNSSLGGQQVSCPHCRGVVMLPAMAGHPQPGRWRRRSIREARAAGNARIRGTGDAGSAARSGARVSAGRPGARTRAAGARSPLGPRAGLSSAATGAVASGATFGGPAAGVPQQPQVPVGQERPMPGPRSSVRFGRSRCGSGQACRAQQVPGDADWSKISRRLSRRTWAAGWPHRTKGRRERRGCR